MTLIGLGLAIADLLAPKTNRPGLGEGSAQGDGERDRRRRLMRIEIALGTAVYLGFSAIDWLVVPGIAPLLTVLKFGLALPLALLLLRFVADPARSLASQQVAAGGVAVVFAALFALALALSNDPHAPVYLMATNGILIFAVSLLALPFRLASSVAASIIAIEVAAASAAPFASVTAVLATLFASISIAALALYANGRRSQERRRHFTMLRREEVRLATIARQRDMLVRLAAIDPLTGLLNRRGLETDLEAKLGRADGRDTISVTMIDIDCFKAYNDAYGHPAGDEVLRKVAACLREISGESASVARLGGEEFVVVEIGVEACLLRLCGERLRQSIMALEIDHLANTALDRLTVCIGIACDTCRGCDLPALFAAADEALYAAKASGRNRVVVAGTTAMDGEIAPSATSADPQAS
ncbi:GGDEF domain-containing protein [Fulvimarina endophytica]|uniref:diguanylate cyclase n=1 Tax=Fulvimarina endophytica TaxID=2293836 RepID=A0A371X564_9HYPH|nr:GGDEF domain-containing protein [Fulvimarina endophytica]RFC64362.1 GGDEF domain-containing protein [Fulvimarina endophytica]